MGGGAPPQAAAPQAVRAPVGQPAGDGFAGITGDLVDGRFSEKEAKPIANQNFYIFLINFIINFISNQLNKSFNITKNSQAKHYIYTQYYSIKLTIIYINFILLNIFI